MLLQTLSTIQGSVIFFILNMCATSISKKNTFNDVLIYITSIGWNFHPISLLIYKKLVLIESPYDKVGMIKLTLTQYLQNGKSSKLIILKILFWSDNI